MTDTKTKYPSAVYAAAGVGDLVYQQLRLLQDKAIAFGTEAGTKAPQWKKKVADLSAKVDANKVRESVITGTQVAAERATRLYDDLVARGERTFSSAPEATAPATKANAKAKAADTAGNAADTAGDAPVAKVAKKAAPRKKAA